MRTRTTVAFKWEKLSLGPTNSARIRYFWKRYNSHYLSLSSRLETHWMVGVKNEARSVLRLASDLLEQ